MICSWVEFGDEKMLSKSLDCEFNIEVLSYDSFVFRVSS